MEQGNGSCSFEARLAASVSKEADEGSAEIFDNLIGCTNLLRQINFEFNRDLFNLTFLK